MRSILSLSLSSLGLAVLLAAPSALALPYCYQIDDSFCAPIPSCTAQIVWLGTCSNGKRQYQCKWTGGACDPAEYSGVAECCCHDCGGGSHGCDCLLAGAAVHLADGTTKPVEKIEVGDRVLSFDLGEQRTVESEVLDVHRPYSTDVYYVINGRLRATESHPVLTRAGWTAVSELERGDLIRMDGDREAMVTSIEIVKETATVYNFQVAAGTYIADGMIVHNKEDCELYVLYPNE